MYHLTPETLIRIEDASDPKRGFITRSWASICDLRGMTPGKEFSLRKRGQCEWSTFKMYHPDAITEV